MARLIPSPPDGTPPNDFERYVQNTLCAQLPEGYLVLPNFVIKPSKNATAFEYDVVVIAPHAIYVIECKQWIGRITGDDTEWMINGRTPKPSPMNLPDLKCKILKTHLGPPAKSVLVIPLYIIPDGTQVLVGGGWASRLQTMSGAIKFLQDRMQIGATAAPMKRNQQEAFVATIQGAWGARVRGRRRTVGGYDLVEFLNAEAGREDWRAKRALLDDPTPYRVRIWTVPPDASAAERAKRMEVIKRPTVAVQSIGAHPNLLRVQEFNELPDEGAFYEVTEWSEYGTLHGFLRNHEQPPTVRERLEIAAGMASALVAIHATGVVHRNLCPEAILIGFDRKPRLTDFDRAYVERDGTQTVFAQVKHRNEAYVPPELADKTDYDFGPESDCYALGVLVYELFVGQPPFPNPRAAADAQGEPPTLPSQVVAGLTPQIDDIVLALLNTDDFHLRPQAAEALAVFGEALGSTTGRREPAVPTPRPVSFEEGSIIAGSFKVEGLVGEGGFARVYRVQHLTQGKTWAMKVVKNAEDAELAIREWKTGDSLPRHPNIAEIQWLDNLPAPDGRPYVITELVEGEDLRPWCEGRKVLPLTEVQRIGARLLEALEALHPDAERIAELSARTLSATEAEELERLRKSGFIHRDIKPTNILLDRKGEPKLIDFNIATPAQRAEGAVGTPRYWAPDRARGLPSQDLFSLGVVLYELAVGEHPFPHRDPLAGTPYRPEQLHPQSTISREFADFLYKAVQPKHEDRFQTAAAMRAALMAIPSLHKPVSTAPTPEQFDELSLEPGEVGRPDYNPFVTRLLTLFSQARVSNAGTRGLDEIATRTYVETRLDTELAPAILDGRFRLVIVTGNAGDGKTAFLQKLEAQFRPRVTDMRKEGRNGASWSYDGVSYVSNYDGSQDERDEDNDTVLSKFFEPFKGKSLAGLGGNDARLIAINEGRLRDFLDHSKQSKDFEGLRQAVTEFFTEGKELPEGLLIVNLNLRAVAAGGERSLVERQLKAMLDSKMWAPCEACRYKAWCPLLSNARTLSDSASGQAVRERVRRLFEVVHLRRQQHVTMRDLRSALSWLLLRDTGCADVAKIVASEDATLQLAQLSYTQAFARDTRDPGDRLVRLLRDVDVGEVETPNLDRRLNIDPWTAIPWMVFESRGSHQDDVWQALVRQTPDHQDTPDLARVLAERRRLLRMLRRRAWFERLDRGWTTTLPYRSLGLLERVIAPPSPEEGEAARAELKGAIIEAISLLEGVRHPKVRRDAICLRASRVKGATAYSFRLFDASRFALELDQGNAASRFLEIEPDTVTLRATDTEIGRVELRLTLDLVEMLEMVRHGFRPNTSDMGGLFVNLLIFRNALLHLPYTSVLVTTDNEAFYEVAARTTAQQELALSISRRESAT